MYVCLHLLVRGRIPGREAMEAYKRPDMNCSTMAWSILRVARRAFMRRATCLEVWRKEHPGIYAR